MNVYCPKGLHHGVFQGLDSVICKHDFWVPAWDSERLPKPDCVKIMTQEMLNDPDDNFFGSILVQSPEDYELVKNFDKPIIYYHLINSRGKGLNHIYNNIKVIPVFLAASCRISYGVYEGKHKTIYHGVDEDFWSGWVGNEDLLISVKNAFSTRDPNRYLLFKEVCKNHRHIVAGSGQDIDLKVIDLRNKLRTCRAFMNIEIVASPFDTSCVEAMMLGMPIVSTDSESSGEFIRNGIEGFISNNVAYLQKKIKDLINDHDMAKELGANARRTAQQRFSKKQFNIQWNDFLNNLDFYKRG